MSTNSESFIDESVLVLLKKVCEKQGISNPEYAVNKATIRGDGYMGIINAAKIKKNGEELLSIITKTSPKDDIFRQQTNTRQIYIHEILFYDEVFPSFYKFQVEKGIEEPFNDVAKCYATSMEDTLEGLALENLCDKGYRVWNRMLPMDKNHISLTIKEYAKFHAVSFAFKDQHREKFDEFCGKLVDLFEHYMKNPMHLEVFEGLLKQFHEYLDPESDKEHLVKFAKYLKTASEVNNQFTSRTMDDYSVIGHGDCWCNNMMYKYEDPTNLQYPTGICFLDFQIIRHVSPVMDLTHFFYTASPKKVMDNYKYYLEFYYKNLCDFIKQLGSDPEKVYPRYVFDTHWKKYCTNGLNIAMFMIKIMSTESDETPDFSQGISKEESLMSKMVYEPRNTDYRKRVKDVIVHFCENDLI